MDADQLHQIEELFHKTRVLDPADRAAYLDEACAGALELRAEVESLLSHSDRGTSQLDLRAPPEQSTIVNRGQLSEGPGTRIGPYKILQQIGEGGFGVVYMAEQEEPVQRKVALKIIKLGMDTKQVIARFEAERQALALMDHPNIARVFDAGATATGRPYFVMELVRGIPLTKFCDHRRLTTPDRLKLFIHVCHAVQHAHQKGIIHRDLKPSNVLVTLHDDVPVPKVIDFGIAKATSRRLTEKTLFTEFRQMIGTPEYMSPDQAEISGLDVDTRTDIYSLGVLLYELLTGTTPLDPQTLRSRGFAEIQRLIAEVEPPMPSTRVQTLESDSSGSGTSSQAEVGHHRRIEPTALSRLLRGELDWIVMKAIEKDRTRRYQTANELAADIKRYLGNEPIMAGPPGPVYRFQKFVRRNRMGVLAGGLIAAALVAGLSLATAGFVRASQEARHSQNVSVFLQSLMDLEAGGGGDPVSVDEIIARSRELFGNDHAVVGTLLMSRASSLETGGQLDEAIEAQRQALTYYREAHEGDHPTTAAALGSLAELLEKRNDFVEAEEAYRERLAMNRRLYGDQSALTGDALDHLTDLLTNTGNQARNDEIRDLWTETVDVYRAALGDRHRTTVQELCKLGIWLLNHGYADEASPVLEQAVPLARRVLDKNDLTLFLTLNALAQHRIFHQRDTAGAIPIVQEMIPICDRIWGTCATTLALHAQLAVFHQEVGNTRAAERAMEEFLATRREHEIKPDLMFLAAEQQAWIAMKSWLNREPDSGREFLLHVINDCREIISLRASAAHPVLREIAAWMIKHDFDVDAELLLTERLGILRDVEPVDTKQLCATLVTLGAVRTRLGQPSEGELILRECLALRQEDLEPGDWLIASIKSTLGFCLTEQGRFEEAEPLVVDGYGGIRSNPLAPPERRQEAQERVVSLYEKWDKPQEAARWRDGVPSGSD